MVNRVEVNEMESPWPSGAGRWDGGAETPVVPSGGASSHGTAPG